MDESILHKTKTQLPILRTGELLISHGIITRDELDICMNKQSNDAIHSKIGHIVVELGFATARDVTRAIAGHCGCSFIDVSEKHCNPEAMRVLPGSFIVKHNLLPLEVNDMTLAIAMEAFNNPFLLAEIAHRSGLQVHAFAATSEDIQRARNAIEPEHAAYIYAPTEDQVHSLDSIIGQVSVDDLQVVEDQGDDESDLEVTATESPIVKLVSHIIQHGVQSAASDIHIEPYQSTFRVRYRVDGDLVIGVMPPKSLLPAVVSRIKILAGMDISERRMPQDGSVTVQLNNRAIDLRVSTMSTRHGEKVVMRVIDREAGILTLDQLGMRDPIRSALQSITANPNGLVLVTGPTGSGKSTTLYSVLTEIANDLRNTSTIEDPVERRLAGVNQFQIHDKAGFTFSSALRSMLRQDPDVIMVGEIRDSATALLAVEASLTGHLVLSTLHTNDAESAIPRLINMGVEGYMIAATLRGVLAQRLVKRNCPHCRSTVLPDPAQAQILKAICGNQYLIDGASKGTGCSKCYGRGTIGRIGVFDLLVMNDQVLSAILSGQSTTDFHQSIRRDGPPGLLSDGLVKLNQGEIELGYFLQLLSHTEPTDSQMNTNCAA